MVVIVRILKQEFFCHWQLIDPKKLKTVGVNTFTVNIIRTSVLFLLLHFATKAVFVKISQSETSQSVFFSFKIPFVEN